jgi:hypothetical protein
MFKGITVYVNSTNRQMKSHFVLVFVLTVKSRQAVMVVRSTQFWLHIVIQIVTKVTSV